MVFYIFGYSTAKNSYIACTLLSCQTKKGISNSCINSTLTSYPKIHTFFFQLINFKIHHMMQTQMNQQHVSQNQVPSKGYIFLNFIENPKSKHCVAEEPKFSDKKNWFDLLHATYEIQVFLYRNKIEQQCCIFREVDRKN